MNLKLIFSPISQFMPSSQFLMIICGSIKDLFKYFFSLLTFLLFLLVFLVFELSHLSSLYTENTVFVSVITENFTCSQSLTSVSFSFLFLPCDQLVAFGNACIGCII